MRLSTDEEHQKNSFDYQESHCRDRARQLGFVVIDVVRDTVSGATLDRPGLSRVLELTRVQAFDVLLVQRQDRLTRDEFGYQFILQTLRENNVRLVSASEELDFTTAAGLFNAGVLNLVAGLERRQIQDRILRGNRAKVLKGQWLGGTVPFGYAMGPNSVLVPEPDEAVVVQRIYRMSVEEGVGATTVRKRLVDDGLKHRNGRPFSNDNVRRILTNPVYIGKQRHLGDVLDALHDPIVDEDLWHHAQKRFSDEVRRDSRPPDDSLYLLTGSTRCGTCGAAVVGSASNNRHGSRYRYYACARQKKHGVAECAGPSVRADLLEIAVLECLITAYEGTGIFREARAKACADTPSRVEAFNAEMTAISGTLTQNQRKLDKYYAAFEADQLSPGTLADRVEELAEVRMRLRGRQVELEELVRDSAFDLPSSDELHDVADMLTSAYQKGHLQTLRQFLRLMIESITINPDGSVRPILRVPSASTGAGAATGNLTTKDKGSHV